MSPRDEEPLGEIEARLMGLIVAAAIEAGRAVGGTPQGKLTVIQNARVYSQYLRDGRILDR